MSEGLNPKDDSRAEFHASNERYKTEDLTKLQAELGDAKTKASFLDETIHDTVSEKGEASDDLINARRKAEGRIVHIKGELAERSIERNANTERARQHLEAKREDYEEQAEIDANAAGHTIDRETRVTDAVNEARNQIDAESADNVGS